MSELDDALSALLGSPENMQKIAALASTLSGARPSGEQASAQGGAPPPAESDIPGVDIAQMMKLFSAAIDDKSAALLKALKPFLSPERAEKVDRAMNAARLARIAQAALMKEKD